MGLLQDQTQSTASCPGQPLVHLDTLWIQVAGTLCNLKCAHCFLSCGPGDDRHALMSREAVREWVEEALPLGVKEFYFTGGEPFLHPRLLEILADTLPHGPCTVLTNGTLLTPRRLDGLRRLAEATRYALELRVSLDGWRAADHDALRGAGSFARTMAAVVALERHGLPPIVTVTRLTDEPAGDVHRRCVAMLRAAGVVRPRLKLLPLFRLGRQAARTTPSAGDEILAGLPAACIDPPRLQCASCRAVTSRGVFVCPLLVDEPGGRMGARLAEALGSFRLAHGACMTCRVTGMTCANG